jgi:hypothetical protein
MDKSREQLLETLRDQKQEIIKLKQQLITKHPPIHNKVTKLMNQINQKDKVINQLGRNMKNREDIHNTKMKEIEKKFGDTDLKKLQRKTTAIATKMVNNLQLCNAKLSTCNDLNTELQKRAEENLISKNTAVHARDSALRERDAIKKLLETTRLNNTIRLAKCYASIKPVAVDDTLKWLEDLIDVDDDDLVGVGGDPLAKYY